jgi:hypothetical protein
LMEITSLEQFKEFRSKDGYFVVTDTLGKKVHITKCRTIDVSTFTEKVLETKKNGKYFFFSDLIDANEAFKVKKCDVCRRFM